MADGDVMNGVV